MSICLIPGDINLEHLVKVRYQAELVDPKKVHILVPRTYKHYLIGGLGGESYL